MEKAPFWLCPLVACPSTSSAVIGMEAKQPVVVGIMKIRRNTSRVRRDIDQTNDGVGLGPRRASLLR